MTFAEVVNALLLLGGGGLVAELLRSLVQRRKMSADVAGQLTESAMALLLPLRERVVELETETGNLRADLHDARDEADLLRAELHEARTELAELRGLPRPAKPRRHDDGPRKRDTP